MKTPASAREPSMVAYRDPAIPIEQRVGDLLGRMTLAEKVAQVGSLWAFQILGPGGLDHEAVDGHLAAGIGEITRLTGSTRLDAWSAAAVHNEIQRYLVEQTRLGIPAIVHEETLHGLMAVDAPCFQQAIGSASTWDPELVRSVATTIRRRMLATGARHALAPVLDISMDARWGRIEETYGEDPYLAACLGTAYVQGIQGDEFANGIIATGKHMVGHGLAEGGRNQGPVRIGRREMLDEQLFAFEAAVRVGGLRSIMPAYCDVDGIPAHASREILQDILRDAWGFDGLVASDYRGVSMISTQHQMTDDLGEAARLALTAGVDIELPTSLAYAAPLIEAIDDGRLDPAILDASVRRVLTAKFRLGLFEHPYVDLPDAQVLEALAADESRLGRDLARSSLVLLENAGVLPIAAAISRIAVIGPFADSARDLLGDYSFVAHVDALRDLHGLEVSGIEDGRPALRAKVATPTILDGIRERFAGVGITHARGTGILEGTDTEIEEAVSMSAAADIAIVVLGERSGLTLDATTGEARDRLGLGFLGRQQELLEAVVATGTPVVLVVVSGRPLALEWAAMHCAAIVLAWVPGDAGGEAVAALLAGDIDAAGRLPVSVARDVGQMPLTYRHRPSGGRSHWHGDYVDGSVTPRWPFGFGRSYTAWEFADLRVDDPDVATDGGELVVRIDVRNTGDRAGSQVVQLYVRDEAASVTRAILELQGFARVEAAAGQRHTVEFRLSAEQFAYTGADYRRIIEPGAMTLHVGASSGELTLTASFRLVGDIVELPDREHFFTQVAVRPS